MWGLNPGPGDQEFHGLLAELTSAPQSDAFIFILIFYIYLFDTQRETHTAREGT